MGEMKIIARIRSDFPTKFGIPRQSGLAASLTATVVFEPEYRSSEAVRGLERFSHIWLIWEFSETARATWSPTVRPPRLGGNKRVGVFATRSPFRPNPIGLSSVRLEAVELCGELGPTLHISGADLMDGTPIFDIKPYLPYVDSHPEASEGFAGEVKEHGLSVCVPEELLQRIPEGKREGLKEVLSQDPRPAYHNASGRVYGFEFSGFEIRFQVRGQELSVCEIREC